ncbi:MAG: hypothetical protein MJ162_00765 [Treponema sp.]|nr:hypothetical protein [Treponema sp.]
MKKIAAWGALFVALALSFVSCDLPEDSTPTFKDTEYVKLRKEGKFKKIPSWIKGYWSDAEESLATSESYLFTDDNFFYDWGRTQMFNMTLRGINANLNKFTEDATDTSYTVTFADYYKDDSYYESHEKKDWVFKFEKTSDGICLTESKGDTNITPIDFEKGKLLLPTWIRNTTWAFSNGLVELKFTTANLVVINKSSGKDMDFTDTILPYIEGFGYFEYTKNTGYIESRDESSYSITITDGETTLYNKFEIKDENTLTWTQGDSSVEMLKK